MKILAKYDIRGIQKFIFRTKKLGEIRRVQDIPEKIIFEAFRNTVSEICSLCMDKNCTDEEWTTTLQKQGIDILDRAGGNAYILYDCDNAQELYETISKKMAFYILKKTYSLELVYTCVECTDNFFEDYENLNAELGKLKSQMPSAYHMGAFPICRCDSDTLLPIVGRIQYRNENGDVTDIRDFSEESRLKTEFDSALLKNREDTQIDNYIQNKGVDSHIAIIHIDGNNMGQRINEVLKTANYDNIKEKFVSIKVRDRFAEVCKKMEQLTETYITEVILPHTNKKRKDVHLVYAIIQAGDDITYITRADIALSFTRKFIELVSKEYMLDNTDDAKYLISACAGIAFIDSHFPFSDGYDLAEKCCASAKSRAKANKSESGYIGNWIDFEICEHISNVDLTSNRKLYAAVGNTILCKKPYCIRHDMYANDFFDFDRFEKKLQSLIAKKPLMNRSRIKDFREAYVAGEEFVRILKNASESRGYLKNGNISFYDDITTENGKTIRYASYYDAIEIMDLYTEFSVKSESEEG